MKNYISNQNSKFYIKKQNGSFYIRTADASSSFLHEATGAINFEPFFDSNMVWYFDFSWNIEGDLEKEINFSWELGQGELYWYRIETECTQLNCETGSLSDNCTANMTTITTVAARNVTEVCEVLNSSSLNPPINQKITSIKRYSRPVVRNEETDDCNILYEQEICHIPECLNYCVDEDIVFEFEFKPFVVDSLFDYDATGGLFISGRVETQGNRTYNPQNPLISVGGFSLVDVVFVFDKVSNLFNLTSDIDIFSTFYNYEFDGSLFINGQARSESPKRKTYETQGSFVIEGTSSLSTSVLFDGYILISGSSYVYVESNFEMDGGINLEGDFDFGSPYHSYTTSGSFILNSDFDFNFNQLGLVVSNFSLEVDSFDLNIEYNDPQYQSSLTIADYTVAPECGCSPVGLFLSATHNLNNSDFIAKFLRRNNFELPESLNLRYRTNDNSWYGSKHYSGSLNQNYLEDFSLFFIFSCKGTYWQFDFIAKFLNNINDVEKYTRFSAQIPSDLICSDNNISTDLEIKINSEEPYSSNGQQIQVVSPDRVFITQTPGVVFSVDDIENDFSTYYDDIGIFKNSYWSNIPFEIRIEPISRKEMQTFELSKIF